MLLQTGPGATFFFFPSLLAGCKEVDLWLLACAAPASTLILRNSLQFGHVVDHGPLTEILNWAFFLLHNENVGIIEHDSSFFCTNEWVR